MVVAGILQDFRCGLRSLARNPGFALVTILTLSLGIGANSAIFSVVDAVLLRTLPFRDAAGLVTVWRNNLRAGGVQDITSYPIYQEWQDNRVFSGIAAFLPLGANIAGEGAPERVRAAMVTANFFSVLGVKPEQGRGFLAREEQAGEDAVVIISNGLWKRRFGGDPKILGRTVRVRGRELEVVGVMPAGFDFPDEAQAWVPVAPSPEERVERGFYWLYTVARLKPAVSLTEAQAAMDTVAARIAKHDPGQQGIGAMVRPLREYFVGDIRPALLVLLGAVAFVLLIACANIANLLLARTAAREQEMAVRAALGASRSRVLRQLLTESITLSLFGAIAGLLVAGWGVNLLRSFGPSGLRYPTDTLVNPRVLGFTLAVSLLTGLLFGLAPALQLSRPRYNEALNERGPGAVGRQRRLTLKALVVAEVALALVLLISAGLLIRSFSRLQRVDLGFRPQHLLTVSVALTVPDYPEPSRVVAFYRQLLERVRALPGVESAGAASAVLLPEVTNSSRVFLEGRLDPPTEQQVEVAFDAITPDFFRALGARLTKGRPITEQDGESSPPVAIINESMARRFWPGEDPIGKRFKFSPRPHEPEMTVVGVVGDVRRSELAQEERPSCFLPFAQLPQENMTLVVRTSGDPRSLAPAVTRAVWAIDRNQPVTRVATTEELLAERLSLRRFNATLLAVFSLLALALAAVGIYGVISYTVSQNVHDIGIRMALGARSGDVLKMVLGNGLALISLGIAIGLGSAFVASRAISHLLYGVTATDPATFLGVSLLLGLLACVAMYIPARRASRVDPVTALRAE